MTGTETLGHTGYCKTYTVKLTSPFIEGECFSLSDQRSVRQPNKAKWAKSWVVLRKSYDAKNLSHDYLHYRFISRLLNSHKHYLHYTIISAQNTKAKKNLIWKNKNINTASISLGSYEKHAPTNFTLRYVSVLSHNSPIFSDRHGAVSSQTTTLTSTTTTTTGWWMTAEMERGIEGIDPRPAIPSLFLPSVKQVPRGDGFCLPKEWINGSRRGGSGCALDLAEWCSPLGRMEVAEVLLTRLQEKRSCQCLR